ncbi:hypothetical protein GCK32_007582, partial [Trichostrongylus colubriformis]
AAFYPSINYFSFRHFFSHRFHPDIIEQSLDVYNTIEDSINETEELEGDLAGTLAVASSSFYNDSSLAVSVDDEVFTMFESAALEQSTQSIKQIRYLESADLHLEKIHVHQSSAPEHPDLPTWQSLIHIIDWSQPSSKHPPPPFEEFLLDIPVSQRKSLRSVYKPIIEAGAIGIKFSDIQDATSMNCEEVRDALKNLEKECQIVPVGVEAKRWVAAEFASAWCVNVGGKLVSPRPWTMPSGEVCASTVRWMAESVLMTAVSSPGITMKEICFRLEFALQGAAVEDLVTVLEAAGCLKVVDEVFENMNLTSPFQEGQKDITVKYVSPAVDSVERFAKIFGGISLLPAMVGRTETDKEENRLSGRAEVESEMRVTLPMKIAPSSPEVQQATMKAEISSNELSGWERLRLLYTQPSMERDVTVRVTRMSFLCGFFLGGASTYMQAKETYERSNVGRKYLSRSDAFKRRMDYAIVRFAKSGFVMGFKCAFISGSIVVLSTHLAAYRQQFSSWYFPALSGALAVALHEALVGGVFVFPLGIIGSIKAVGLGVTSGLTLTAIVHLYALAVDKSVNEAYWAFKRDYEKDLRHTREFSERVTALMKEEGIWWRGDAAKKLMKLDEEMLTKQDA